MANLSVGDGITKAVDEYSYSVYYEDTADWPQKLTPIDIVYNKGLETQRPTITIQFDVERGYTT